MGNARLHRVYFSKRPYELVRPSSELHSLLHSVVLKAILKRPQIKSLLFTEVGNVAPLHVSLSRPLVLWTREKEDFLNTFRTALKNLEYYPFGSSLT